MFSTRDGRQHSAPSRAFFRRDVLTVLERHGAEYTIKVPFHPWLGLKPRVQQTRVWTRVNATVSCAEHMIEVPPCERHLICAVATGPTSGDRRPRTFACYHFATTSPRTKPHQAKVASLEFVEKTVTWCSVVLRSFAPACPSNL